MMRASVSRFSSLRDTFLLITFKRPRLCEQRDKACFVSLCYVNELFALVVPNLALSVHHEAIVLDFLCGVYSFTWGRLVFIQHRIPTHSGIVETISEGRHVLKYSFLLCFVNKQCSGEFRP